MGCFYSEYELRIRQEFPNSWVAIHNILEGNDRSIMHGEVVAIAPDIATMSAALGKIKDQSAGCVDLIMPENYLQMAAYEHDKNLKYGEWKKSISSCTLGMTSDLAISHYVMCGLFRRPFFNGKEGAFLYWVRDRFVRRCRETDGFLRTLLLTGSGNLAVARGAFQELTRLYGMTMRNLLVAAIGKIVTVPPLGKTDIDVLTMDGLWCESKRVRGGLYLDRGLKLKLRKMALARDAGMQICTKNSNIKIRKLVLSNTNRISETVKQYATSLGVETQEYSVYAFRPY